MKKNIRKCLHSVSRFVILLLVASAVEQKNERNQKKFLQSNRPMWYINQVAFEGRRINKKEIDL